MNEKDWLIIATVWHQQNITRAARQLYLTQPALSYRLKQIEQKLEIQLFEGNGRKLVFSAQGRYLAEHATKMLTESQQLRQTLQALRHPGPGELRLGVTSNYAAYCLPEILAGFCQEHSDLHVNVVSGLSKEMYEKLQRDEIDIAVTKDDYGWKEQKRLIRKDQYQLISAKPIDMELLPQLPQIYINHGGHTAQLIERWWNAHYRLAPRISMQVDKLEVCLAMVVHGLGYAIISGYQTLPESLFCQPLSLEGNDSDSYTWLLYRQQGLLNPAQRSFIELFSELS